MRIIATLHVIFQGQCWQNNKTHHRVRPYFILLAERIKVCAVPTKKGAWREAGRADCVPLHTAMTATPACVECRCVFCCCQRCRDMCTSCLAGEYSCKNVCTRTLFRDRNPAHARPHTKIKPSHVFACAPSWNNWNAQIFVFEPRKMKMIVMAIWELSVQEGLLRHTKPYIMRRTQKIWTVEK